MGREHYHFHHVGSYLRPQVLKDARKAFEQGELSKDELFNLQDKLVKDLVTKEVELNLPIVSDGEFGRSWWHLDFLWHLEGFEAYEQDESYHFHGAKTRRTNVRLVGKVAENENHPFYRDFIYLKSVTPAGYIPKVTIPSPSLIIGRDHRSDLALDFYNTWQDFLDDLAKAYYDTIYHFYELGARYVQLDDTTWAYLLHQLIQEADNPNRIAELKQLAEDDVYVINKALENLPEDLTLATHICRGNFKSTYLFEGAYDGIADYLGRLPYHVYYLEYDDERSGGFEPLERIWNHRPEVTIVLGLITSKFPDLEDEEQVISRINQASQYVPLGNLALSTQCGFASTEEGNVLSEEQEWQKLSLIRSISESVWSH